MINQHMGRFEHNCVSSCLMASYCHFFVLRSGEITGMDACLYTDTVFFLCGYKVGHLEQSNPRCS